MKKYFYLLVVILLTSACDGESMNVNKENIFSYTRGNNVDAINSYVKSGGDVNEVNNEGNSLLMLAINNDSYQSFRFLLVSGANPNFRNDQANPRDRLVVMEKAAIADSSAYLKDALEYGGNPNALGSYGNKSVLFQAIMATKIDNVKLLVASGADINAIGINGKTPIHTAISINNYEIACYLLEAGADLSIKNKWGYSPIDTLKTFGDGGIKLGSEHYTWYLTFLEKLDIDPLSIAKTRDK